jgi:hypothetical protein
LASIVSSWQQGLLQLRSGPAFDGGPDIVVQASKAAGRIVPVNWARMVQAWS